MAGSGFGVLAQFPRLMFASWLSLALHLAAGYSFGRPKVRQFYHDLLIGLKQCDVPAWSNKTYL